jgi:energy-coupling factor transporter ATP-binding protein EcfA2
MLGDVPRAPADGWLSDSLDVAPSGGQQVRLLEVGDVANVNALVSGQRLTFGAEGMTVVYGDNGSGKSGYARLIKHVVRARHREEILPNIFGPAEGPPEASVRYALGHEEREERWASQAGGPLSQVAFYDERCGDAYVSVEADVSFRPSALQLLDSLVAGCDGVRSALDQLLQENSGQAQALPSVPDGTPSAAFLQTFGSATTVAELEAACALPDDADRVLEALSAEEGRLRASDPSREMERLQRIAAAAEELAAHLARLDGVIGLSAEETLAILRRTAREKRTAADMASSASFDTEPVTGVGTETWRALWEAARRFSEVEVNPADAFPKTGSEALCPLCHQPLDEDAGQRFHRFHAFMTDDTQSQAVHAERQWSQALVRAQSVQVLTPAAAVNLQTIEGLPGGLEPAVRQHLERYEQRRLALSAWDEKSALPLPDASADVVSRLTALAQESKAASSALDATEIRSLLGQVIARRQAVEARRVMRAHSEVMMAELTRRRSRARIEAARRETDTTGITRKSTELTRAYVTANVQDRFSRESDRLGVERVTLQDSGGRKGQLRHRPAFLSAHVRAELPRVLSEGEQTALGLAGFFTEAFFDDTKSALVLDDPMTSLDHLRRGRVAARLAGLSRDRQVIVFTHDVTFSADLRRACEEAAVPFTERSVERRRKDDAPGICMDKHPWSVKDANARLGTLEADLAKIKRDEGEWDRETYERETGVWAGNLSETWERILSMEIANFLVNRGTLEVHVRGLKLMARITEDDNQELQQSYGRCSQWAKRHDKDGQLNYTAPSVGELEAELTLVRTWLAKVRKYQR